MKTTHVYANGKKVPVGKCVQVIGATDKFVIHVQSASGVRESEIRRLIGAKRKVGHIEHVQRQYTAAPR